MIDEYSKEDFMYDSISAVENEKAALLEQVQRLQDGEARLSLLLNDCARERNDEASELQKEIDRLRSAFVELSSIIRENVKIAPEPHVLIIEDGSKHTGPAVDYLIRVTDLIATFCEKQVKS